MDDLNLYDSDDDGLSSYTLKATFLLCTLCCITHAQ